MQKIIALEGINRVGKTTVANAVIELLRTDGYNVQYVAETKSKFGKHLMQFYADYPNIDPCTDAMLFATMRRYVLQETMVASGPHLIFDRYLWSSMVYHGQDCAGGVEFVRYVNKFAPPPDHVILLDADPEVIRERSACTTLREKYWDDDEFQKLARLGYLALAEGASDTTTIVDCTRHLDDVVAEVTTTIQQVLS